MLRYNATTILKLNAIARHIEPPGAVIFSSEDLAVQLNQSDTKQLNSVSPLKHPKMLKKLLNKETVESEQNNMSVTQTTGQPPIAVRTDNEIIKKASISPAYKKEFNKNVFDLEKNSRESMRMQNYPLKDDRRITDRVFELDQEIPDEYDQYLNYEQERKIPMRTKYSTNRDVRSKTELTDLSGR